MKQCNNCLEFKDEIDYNKDKARKSGLRNICRSCESEKRKAYLYRVGNGSFKRYEKTHNGFLMRIYRNMKSRITGVQKDSAHLYLGKELLPKEEFYKWAKDSKDFYNLFEAYKDSGFSRRLAPTVDRIDSSKGYFIENMRWLTHSENSRLGSVNNPNKMPVEVYKNGEYIGAFKSIGEASYLTGIGYFHLYNRASGIVKNGSNGIYCSKK